MQKPNNFLNNIFLFCFVVNFFYGHPGQDSLEAEISLDLNGTFLGK